MWKKLLKFRDIAKGFHRVQIRKRKNSSFWFDNWSSLGKIFDITSPRDTLTWTSPLMLLWLQCSNNIEIDVIECLLLMRLSARYIIYKVVIMQGKTSLFGNLQTTNSQNSSVWGEFWNFWNRIIRQKSGIRVFGSLTQRLSINSLLGWFCIIDWQRVTDFKNWM